MAEALHRIETLGRFIIRQLRQLERQMAERNFTTQEILDEVRRQKGEIASMSAMLGGMKARLNAALAGEISPKGQSILNDIMSELQGNSRALVNAQVNSDDDPSNDVDVETGQPLNQGGQGNQGSGPGSVGSGNQGPSKQLAVTTLSLSADPTSAMMGQTIHLSAGLSTQADVGSYPTGTVVFMIDDEEIGSAGMDSTGVAAMSIADLPAGEHSVTAEYQGDENYASSTSQSLDLTVTDASKNEPVGGAEGGTNVGNGNQDPQLGNQPQQGGNPTPAPQSPGDAEKQPA